MLTPTVTPDTTPAVGSESIILNMCIELISR